MGRKKQTYLKKKYYATSVGKKHRRIIKMFKKINPHLYIGGAMFVVMIMYTIYEHLIQYSQEIFFVLATLAVMLVISVIIYLANLAHGTIHHAKRTKIETDRLEAIKEQEAGKGEQERNRASLLYVEADKTNAEIEHRKAETEHLKTETMGQQIENAYNSVKVQAAQAFLPHADSYYREMIQGAKLPSLTFSGSSFSLTSKSPRSIVNNSVGELGPGKQEQRVNFLDHIKERGFNRIGLIGAQGGGKTTALRWYADLLNEMRPDGMKFVLDPHAPPHKWPTNFSVIGAGRNYFEIAKFFVWLFNEAIPTRYTHQAEGKTDFIPIDILSDEWVTIVANMRKTKIWTDENILSLFTEPRKINIGMALCLHDTTNKSFGISSGASLKGALQANFYFEEDAMTGERIARLGVGIPNKSKIIYYPCDMPGPYPERFHSDDATEQESDKWMKANRERIEKFQLAPASGDVMDLSDFMEKPKSGHAQVKLNDDFLLQTMMTLMNEYGETSATEVMKKCSVNTTDGHFRKRVNDIAKSNEIKLGRAKKR